MTTNTETARTLAETGQNPTRLELEGMLPDLRRRDYVEILFAIRQLRRGPQEMSRHERRARPHPESRYHATELDSTNLKELKRSAFEMQILFQAHNKRARKVRAMQRAA